MNMDKEKSIYECYQEIKQREIKELKEAITKAGGEILFDEETAPVVVVNFDSYYPHPADVRITSVQIEKDRLIIIGCEKCSSGCSDWYEDETEIEIEDIAYRQIDFITSDIISGNYLPTWEASTGCLSDGSWCAIDTDDMSWEYQSDCDDDDTYVSGNFVLDDDDDKLVIDFDGCETLPKGVKAALIATGYRLEL